jgi:Cell wall-active antibiotics response 4TMS YvqF/Domain of unknown function (DUF1707)
MEPPSPPKEAPALLDARREEVTHVLAEAFSSDRLDIEQLEDRAKRAHDATSLEALDALVADLPKPTTLVRVPQVFEATVVEERRLLRSVFGNLERRGTWVAPARMTVTAAFGNVELDFRQAEWVSRVTEIDAHVVVGNLEITVPPDVCVEAEGQSVLGNFENHAGSGANDGERTVLKIRARVVFGNVEVHVRARDGATSGQGSAKLLKG